MNYKVLIPLMLDPHLDLVAKAMQKPGYDFIVLDNTDQSVKEAGLKYVHNDMCYPCILVVGQFMDYIEKHHLDPSKCYLMMTQTGGGCRASNYFYLIHKALKKANIDDQVTVVSISTKLFKDNPLNFTKKQILRGLMGVIYGDIVLTLKNQCLPYEVNKGETKETIKRVKQKLLERVDSKDYMSVKKMTQLIVKEFNKVKRHKIDRPKVGIVGEIYLNYSPFGNNHLEEKLVSEGAEPVLSGFLNFFVYNNESQKTLKHNYGNVKNTNLFLRLNIIKYVEHLQKKISQIIESESDFRGLENFATIKDFDENILSKSVNMGEGWLLPAEITAFIKKGINNIIIVQPFGCLPNHIVARGTMSTIKEKFPKSNIISIDYDPGTSITNQENRIKLLLMNAHKEN